MSTQLILSEEEKQKIFKNYRQLIIFFLLTVGLLSYALSSKITGSLSFSSNFAEGLLSYALQKL
jgi:hypothetical protein